MNINIREILLIICVVFLFIENRRQSSLIVLLRADLNFTRAKIRLLEKEKNK